MNRSLLLLACISLLAILPFSAHADFITVSGDVSGVWDVDSVIVTGEVRVPPGETLQIMPGVEVLFQGSYKFFIFSGATLRAVGIETDSIRFDVYSYGVGNGWGGLRFIYASDSCMLDRCHITHGQATSAEPYGGAIYCSYSRMRIQNCLIDSSEATSYGGAIYCLGSVGPVIAGNSIIANSAHYGGAIYCTHYEGSVNNASITNNLIIGNTSTFHGGAIYCNTSVSILGNTISCNHSGLDGGAIYCDDCDPLISENTLSHNNSDGGGGGIYCQNSGAQIVSNSIRECSAGGLDRGGGIYCYSSDLTIGENCIEQNSAWGGGGIYCANSNAVISNNSITENMAADPGGGILCAGSNPTVFANVISANVSLFGYGGGLFCESATYANVLANDISVNSAFLGGGMYCESNSYPIIEGNRFHENSAGAQGGGLFLYSTPVSLHSNEFARNRAGTGGGVYCGISQVTMYCNTITNNQAFSGSGVFGSGGTLINCIVWQNTGNQIGFYPGGSFTITYSDIQDSLWPGQGNISADPIFVNPEQNDYRLLWGSPCIDSGDPNPQYNDPDSSRSDMGAFYYDQSVPVRVLLTPYNAPIQIPPEGGTFDYAITASNCTGSPLMADFWCDATLPSESLTEPLLGPRAATIPAYDNVSVMRTQRVPGAMPKAITYNGYAVVGADTSKDGFSVWIGTWGQQSATGRTQAAAPLPFAMGNWSNWGEWFEIAGRAQSAVPLHPTEFALHPAAPNPFNASTALSFQLPANSFVSLRVYDTAGRLVETLVKGWREAGSHEVTFDASNLASGVYICCLASESTQAVQKMLLIK